MPSRSASSQLSSQSRIASVRRQPEQKKLQELLKERKELIRLRMANKKEIYKHHLLFSQKITASLKNSVDNLFISIKYLEGRYSPEFENTLKDWKCPLQL